jgi:hypothetical protein
MVCVDLTCLLNSPCQTRVPIDDWLNLGGDRSRHFYDISNELSIILPSFKVIVTRVLSLDIAETLCKGNTWATLRPGEIKGHYIEYDCAL